MFSIDHANFLALYSNQYPAPQANAAAGFDALLGFVAQDPEVTDVRWAAYMLATVKHECADTWQPIEEHGKGQGRSYGQPETVTDADGTTFTNTYYGRGYVQLTFKENYERMSERLGLGARLLIHPELALQPETAYAIMSYGMRHGSFSGKSLKDYIHDDVCDYFNARRIINVLDRADLIKDYAEKLEAMLRGSLANN